MDPFNKFGINYFGPAILVLICSQVLICNTASQDVDTIGRTKYTGLLKEYYHRFTLADTGQNSVSPSAPLTRQEFEPYKGLIIRNITVKQVDILEGSVEDTSLTVSTGFGKFLNKAHFETKPWIVKRYLRFGQNEVLSPEVLAENERMLRNLSFLQDARIHVQHSDPENDSVDILIITQDIFPIGIGGYFNSFKNFGVDPYTRNFVGLGHALAGKFVWDAYALQRFGYGASYRVENIQGTFTNLDFTFEDLKHHNLFQVRATKPFLTNDIKTGGEIKLYQINTVLYWGERKGDSVRLYATPYRKNAIDLWWGKSLFPDRKNTNRIVNLGLAYTRDKFIERPYSDMDSNRLFHHKNAYLGSITYSNIEHYKTNRLLGYGITEDAALGVFIKFTSGISHNKYRVRPYGGIDFGVADNFDRLGYITFNAAVGSYINDGKPEDSKLGTRLVYFSPLTGSDRFSLRHFVIPSFTSTSNRVYLRQENFGKRIRGLRQDYIYGSSTMTLQYESVFYTPWSFAGFKISASCFADAGWISYRDFMTGSKDFYSVMGISFIIKNESLTIPSLHMRIGFYPKWEEERNKFKVTFSFSDRRIFQDILTFKPRVLY